MDLNELFQWGNDGNAKFALDLCEMDNGGYSWVISFTAGSPVAYGAVYPTRDEAMAVIKELFPDRKHICFSETRAVQ